MKELKKPLNEKHPKEGTPKSETTKRERSRLGSTNQKIFRKHLIGCILFTLFFALFTYLVKNFMVDETIVSSPTGEVSAATAVSIGFSGANLSFRDSIGYNDTLYTITKYLGYLLFIPIVVFAFLGLYQLITRKSFKKVNRELKLLIPFYVAVAAVYVIFEKLIIINYRPFVIDGALESSYPSSHTLFAMCICCSAMMVIARLMREKHAKLAVLINLALTILMLATVVGRLFSGVHWLTDILGGIFISSTLLFFFATFLQHEPKSKQD